MSIPRLKQRRFCEWVNVLLNDIIVESRTLSPCSFLHCISKLPLHLFMVPFYFSVFVILRFIYSYVIFYHLLMKQCKVCFWNSYPSTYDWNRSLFHISFIYCLDGLLHWNILWFNYTVSHVSNCKLQLLEGDVHKLTLSRIKSAKTLPEKDE